MRSRILTIVLCLSLLSGWAPTTPAQEEGPTTPKGWLGVFLDRAPSRARGDDATPRPAGAVVSRVIENSPAAKAGLRAGDRIVAVEGTTLDSSGALISRIGDMEPDRWISLTVDRKGRELSLSARLAERPDDVRSMQVRTGWIGVQAIDLPASLREHFGAPEEAGVMVSHVEPGSPAEAAGLNLGDVVYEVDGGRVKSVGTLARLVAGGGVGNKLEITLARNGAEIVVEATIIAAPETDEVPARR